MKTYISGPMTGLPDLYCPNCGEKNVWHEDDPGDYYVGEEYQCGSCGAGWNMPSGVMPEQATNEQGAQIFAVISSQNASSDARR